MQDCETSGYEALSQHGVDQSDSAVPTAFALSDSLTETTVADLAAPAPSALFAA